LDRKALIRIGSNYFGKASKLFKEAEETSELNFK
jgi:hypothetical protein